MPEVTQEGRRLELKLDPVSLCSPDSLVSSGFPPTPPLQVCELCKGVAPADSPVVYADRAGYAKQWHPACFVCAKCSEPLVDLIYFWKDGAPWCGRHYCESVRPRCSGCDEVRARAAARLGHPCDGGGGPRGQGACGFTDDVTQREEN